MTHLYLAKLKRMDKEQLMAEVERHGKIMEKKEPMSEEDKNRALMCFKWAHAKGDFDERDKEMLLVAIRVMRLL
jgi:hypothetical protein